MKKFLLFWLLLASSLLPAAGQYRTKLRPNGNDYAFAPQQAKAVVNWKRFPRFSLNHEWIFWGPRFRKRAGAAGEWDDDYLRHGFKSQTLQMNMTGTGNVENERDLALDASQMVGVILMPGAPGANFMTPFFNQLADSDPRKAEIAKYMNNLLPVTDQAAAKLMGNWMGTTIKYAQCGGKNPKWVTIDEESAHYWEHPMGEASLKIYVGYLYQGILEVCQGSRVYTYGPRVTAPYYQGYADRGRTIDGIHFSEHPLYGVNFWWNTGTSSAPLDVNSPLAVALRMNGGGVLAGDHYWRNTIGQGTIYQKNGDGSYVLSNGRRVLRTDNGQATLFGRTFTVYGNDANYYNANEYEYWCNWLYEECETEEANRWWMNGRSYALRKNDRSTDFSGMTLGGWYRTHTEEAHAPGQLDSRPLNPEGIEMGAIFRTLLHDVDLLWHGEYLSRGPTTFGNGAIQYPGITKNPGGITTSLGQYEYIIKGLHRVSEFESRPWGNFYFVRPHKGIAGNPDKWREPVIRGKLSETGNHLLLMGAWPIHDPADVTRVYVWVDTGSWKSGSTYFDISGRKTYLDAWQIPGVPSGTQILPQHLRFRFTTLYGETITWTGDYRYTASNSETMPAGL